MLKIRNKAVVNESGQFIHDSSGEGAALIFKTMRNEHFSIDTALAEIVEVLKEDEICWVHRPGPKFKQHSTRRNEAHCWCRPIKMTYGMTIEEVKAKIGEKALKQYDH